jgi:hypothetical protein
MKITNKQNLPQAFVKMAESDYTPTPKQYSATALLKGVREVILERRHGDKIEQDASDMIWLLFGTAVHSILEKQAEGDTEFKETFVKMPVGDYYVSGRFDLYNATTQTITDYKTCSVWKVIFGDYTDWKKQLLIYGTIMNYCGFPVKHGQIVAIMKDHSKRDAKIKPDYPELPVKTIKFDFTNADFTEIDAFIRDRLKQLSTAEKMTDDELPVCTPEERFNSGDKFAVMRKGRKTALRVLGSAEAADKWKEDNGGDYIELRQGEDKKCKDYCSACEFCNYYHDHVIGGAK